MTTLLLIAGLLLADKQIVVDLNKMKWEAVQDGEVVKTGKAIGGRNRCPEDKKRSCKTPEGTFKIYSKRGYGYRSGEYPVDCEDKKKCGARMYYAMFFHKKGIGLHGSDMMVKKNASHGCVRLYKKDAKWLNKEFVEIGTAVVVLPYK